MAGLYTLKIVTDFAASHALRNYEGACQRLHGHNYSVAARICAPMGPEGFSADYNVYKRRLKKLCDAHDEYMLLAEHSPHHTIDAIDGEYHVVFNGKTLRFPIDETLLLPVVNVTVEELAHYILGLLIEDSGDEDLREVEVFVSSGSGQAGSAVWRAEN